MTEVPELRAAVLGAAIRRAQPVASSAPPPKARRHRPALKTAVLAVGVALVTGSALAATGVWTPQLGDEHRTHPTISASPVPAAQLRAFEVLRRPASPADHGPEVRYALRYLDGQHFEGVRTDAVRLLSTADHGYVLVPTTSVAAGASKTDALCVFAIDIDGGAVGCWTTAEILAHKATLLTVMSPEMSPREREARDNAVRKAAEAAQGRPFTVPGARPPIGDQATVSGLVPDGVAAVEVRYGATAERAPVANNFFTVTVRRHGGAGGPAGPTVTWLDSAGRAVP